MQLVAVNESGTYRSKRVGEAKPQREDDWEDMGEGEQPEHRQR